MGWCSVLLKTTAPSHPELNLQHPPQVSMFHSKDMRCTFLPWLVFKQRLNHKRRNGNPPFYDIWFKEIWMKLFMVGVSVVNLRWSSCFETSLICFSLLCLTYRQHPYAHTCLKQHRPGERSNFSGEETPLFCQIPASGPAPSPQRLGPWHQTARVHGLPAGEVHYGETHLRWTNKKFLLMYEICSLCKIL